MLYLSCIRLYLFFYDLDSLRSAVTDIFCRMPFSWDVSHVFSHGETGATHFAGKATEVRCHSAALHQGNVHPYDLPLLCD